MRIIVRTFLICSIALSGACIPAMAKSTVDGYWDLHVPNPSGDGTFLDTYFQLQQDGNAISGELIRWHYTIPINGTLQNDSIHLVTQPSASTPRWEQQPIVFDGSFAKGKFTLTMQSREGNLHGVVVRVTEDATEPPKQLPLPALHDVPDNGLARTPPMGWNSWNRFADKVDDASVRAMADAMVSSGMSKAGYKYINIDDTWDLGRDAAGNLLPNKKFPNMKALADYVHSKGLKIGIYSSPGPKTCANYPGSYGHVRQDAATFASWGIDYLKYDLCSDLDIYKDDAPTLQAIYQEMGDALQATHRPIVYSLCEYGRAQVWTGWGEKSGGNLWRTTGDIEDKWGSMDKIGFSQIKLSPYVKPGHWNDPDMLEVGNGGMTADEYRTHMSLWSMLAAPLIAGNDLRTMTAETKSILMNTEVIAIDQDPQFQPVTVVSHDGDIEVLMRPLSDGSVAVGLFNRGPEAATAKLSRSSLPAGFNGKELIARDLWRHAQVSIDGDTYTTNVPKHGVVLLRISAH
ncbi:MAG: glycoside hydrolase family 27 protein [Acidobacteriaceae bacterium]